MKTMNKILTIGAMGFALNPMEAKADLFKCTSCPAGYRCDGTSKSICSAGTYSQATASSCTSCSPGKYQSNSGQASCNSCSTGSYASGYGNTYCTQCSAGNYQDATGQSSCKPCPAGTYSNSISGATNCTQCPANTYSKAESTSCTACGYWETSSAGASSCTGLQYVIESTVAELNAGGMEAEGTLSPGFYLIVLGGGDGGYIPAKDTELGVKTYGDGGKLKYIIKVTSNTSYYIASGKDGENAPFYEDEDNSIYDYYGNNRATGGGGGSFAKIGNDNYLAAGGGGSGVTDLDFWDAKILASGGRGGSYGPGQAGGRKYEYDSDYGYYWYNGTEGGKTGGKTCKNKGCSYYDDMVGYDATDKCYDIAYHYYGGEGSVVSKIDCSSFSRVFCHHVESDDDSDTVTIFEIPNQYNRDKDLADKCKGDYGTYLFYFYQARNGEVSHRDNTNGHFSDKLCKNCAKIYKIK